MQPLKKCGMSSTRQVLGQKLVLLTEKPRKAHTKEEARRFLTFSRLSFFNKLSNLRSNKDKHSTHEIVVPESLCAATTFQAIVTKQRQDRNVLFMNVISQPRTFPSVIYTIIDGCTKSLRVSQPLPSPPRLPSAY